MLSCFHSVAEAPDFADREVREVNVLHEWARYFGEQAYAAVHYLERDSATDSFSTECIAPLTPGILSSSGPALNEPMGRIPLGGHRDSGAWCGFMDAAAQPGKRVAEEIREALGREREGMPPT